MKSSLQANIVQTRFTLYTGQRLLNFFSVAQLSRFYDRAIKNMRAKYNIYKYIIQKFCRSDIVASPARQKTRADMTSSAINRFSQEVLHLGYKSC